MASIFTRIITGEIPCHKVEEDERYLAFLDINPLREGHTLVIPKVEVDYLFDLDDDVLAGMLPFGTFWFTRRQRLAMAEIARGTLDRRAV